MRSLESRSSLRRPNAVSALPCATDARLFLCFLRLQGAFSMH